MQPRDVARVYGAGRVALGLALLIAPRPLGRLWLGPPGATPNGGVALRALGARDVMLGAIALHSVNPRGLRPLTAAFGASDPPNAALWQRTCAAVDAVDLLATAAARPALPPGGSALVMGVAAGGAALGAALGSALRSR